MSRCYGVSFTSRTFNYQLSIERTEPVFQIWHLQDIFYDWKKGEFYTKKKIEGFVEISNYDDSRSKILLNFSNENAFIAQEDVAKYTDAFWQEISVHFILPPTHVYLHNPSYDSVFDGGIFWQFCYIYLNSTTKQGIVLEGSATD